MFKNLFGGSKKEEPKVQQPVVASSEIQQESARIEVLKQIEKLETNIEKYTIKMENLDTAIKSDLLNKRKAAAQTKVAEMIQLKKMVQTMENKKHTFVKVKIQLEMAVGDKESVEVFTKVNAVLKEQEAVTEQLQDQLADYQDYTAQTQQMNDLWAVNNFFNFIKQSAQNEDQSEIDDILGEYMKDQNQEEAQKVAQQMNDIQQPNIVQPNKQQNQQPVQNLQQSNFQNAFDEMLN